MSSSPFDLVLYGATGFTGRQASRYLGAHPDRSHLRWAIAGRSAARLEELALECRADAVLVADGTDAAAIGDVAGQARVVATTAGPFAKYGGALLAACAQRGVHYCDITGETPWVRTMIEQHHLRAVASGARVVPFCGYDSVPSDLGALFAVQQLREQTGQDARRVRAFHRARGGLNGGTLASLVHLQREGDVRDLDDPFLLNPADQRPHQPSPLDRDPRWAHYESRLGSWIAPFFMGPINTRVVRRSQALMVEQGKGYGEHFSYQEYWRSSGPLAMLESSSLATFQGVATLFARSPLMAGVLERLGPAPGTGPSEEVMDNGFFECELIAEGDGGGEARVRLQGQGDPGNRITVKCLCESALALALAEADLPALEGGLLTPATALGDVLIERLQRVGIQFDAG